MVVGVKYLITMTGPNSLSCQPVHYGIIVALVSWFCSLPRTFNMLSKLGAASAIFTFVSVLLAAVFATAEGKPAGYDPLVLGEPIVTAFPVPGTTLVAALNAFLNISYTFIGQITLPSFIAEMKDPRYLLVLLAVFHPALLTDDSPGISPRLFGPAPLQKSLFSASLGRSYMPALETST